MEFWCGSMLSDKASTMTRPYTHPIHSSTPLSRRSACLVIVVAAAALACSTGTSPAQGGNGLKFGFQDNSPAQEAASTQTPQNSPASYVPRAATQPEAEPEPVPAPGVVDPAVGLQRAQHDLGTIPAPTLATLRRAEKAGLPGLTEQQKIAGPFDGPQNSVFYMNGEGLVSFYLPDYHAAYFAQAKPFRWIYGVSMAGYFAFDQQNNYLELAEAPEQLLAWPMAYPIAERIATFAHAYIEEEQRVAQGAAPSDTLRHRNLDELSAQEQEIFWDAMGQTATMMNETTMAVIENIGGPGCISHYQDAHFMGCY